ncbi:MAG: CoA transferase subunit A [Chloroflexi bacterium]|nr:CoA transferase subunit A [Chloroflexota bacterium]
MFPAIDKRVTAAEILSEIKDGSVIGIGGWGATRKPMALVRAIARSPVKDLTVLSMAGQDLDLLIGAKKVKKAIFPFAVYDEIPGMALYNFRRARQEATAEFMELSEYMVLSGLRAAGERLPFLPVRSGLGSDILTINPEIKVIEAPYTGEKLVAMPALHLDVAIIHANAADPSGYGQVLGPMNMDSAMVRAAKKVFLCADRIVSVDELGQHPHTVKVWRPFVTGVVEIPYSAHPSRSPPDYGVDMAHMREYTEHAADAQHFPAYLDKYVYGVETQEAYLEKVGGVARLIQLSRGGS